MDVFHIKYFNDVELIENSVVWHYLSNMIWYPNIATMIVTGSDTNNGINANKDHNDVKYIKLPLAIYNNIPTTLPNTMATIC